MSRRAHIGLDRRIDLEWLDAAAAQALAGVSAPELRAALWKLLDGAVSGDRVNSGRGKTVTVLSHIWGEVPGAALHLKQRALAHMAAATPAERLALHWAMLVGTYPIFTDVAAAAGRLLTLQGTFSLAQLTHRLVGLWGERSTLLRAAQRIVRSMVQWGVLRDTETRGMYERVPGSRTVGPAASLVLVEALLVDTDAAALPVDQLVGHPAVFPFALELSVGQLRSTAQFEVHRQGMNADVVELRPVA